MIDAAYLMADTPRPVDVLFSGGVHDGKIIGLVYPPLELWCQAPDQPLGTYQQYRREDRPTEDPSVVYVYVGDTSNPPWEEQ